MFNYALGPTGGLRYHLRAWRSRHTAWPPFRREVDRWLTQLWNPVAPRELLIFGPSAGWTLPLGFLTRYSSIIAVEPDPIARVLLSRRIPRHLQIKFVADPSILPWFSAGRFAKFLDEHASAHVLFSNILGQIPLLRPVRSIGEAREEFLSNLAGRCWASYHDLISVRARSTAALSGMECASLTQASLETLATDLFPKAKTAIDHDMVWLSHNRATHLAVWDLDPEIHHLIGFVFDNGAR
jgi:hypothetical protein